MVLTQCSAMQCKSHVDPLVPEQKVLTHFDPYLGIVGICQVLVSFQGVFQILFALVSRLPQLLPFVVEFLRRSFHLAGVKVTCPGNRAFLLLYRVQLNTIQFLLSINLWGNCWGSIPWQDKWPLTTFVKWWSKYKQNYRTLQNQNIFNFYRFVQTTKCKPEKTGLN